MSVVTSSELNYASPISQHSKIRMSRVLPQGADNLTLSTGSTSQMTFELPNKVYNLSRSTLDWQMSVMDPPASDFNALFTNAYPIDRIELFTRSGRHLCDINNYAQYSRSVTPVVTKMSEFLAQDKNLGGSHASSAASAITAAATAQKGGKIFRSDQVAGTDGVSNAGNGVRVAAGGATADEANSLSYTDINNFTQSPVDAVTGMNYSIPLSEIHHSLMSVDKTLYFGQSLMLRVHFVGSDRLGFILEETAGTTQPIVLAAACAISRARVYLAVETNPLVVQGLVNRVQSQGLQMVIPYVHHNLFSSSSGTASNLQRKLNAADGQRLLNVYHSVYHTTNTASHTYDVSNVGEDKITSIETRLDNNNLQEFVPLSAQNEIYQLQKPLLEDSVIATAQQFKYNQIWIDSFRNGKACDWKDMDTIIDGIPLDSERIWQIDLATAAAAYRQYTWFVVQRTLSISPSGDIDIA